MISLASKGEITNAKVERFSFNLHFKVEKGSSLCYNEKCKSIVINISRGGHIMLNEEKVKVMTRLAIYEKRKGKEEVPVSQYYKSDYVKYNVLKTAVSVTIAYWMVVALVVAVRVEELLGQLNSLAYKEIAWRLMAGYLACLMVYLLIARFLYAYRYEKIRPHIIIYNHYLKKLKELHEKRTNDMPRNYREKGVINGNDEFVDY